MVGQTRRKRWPFPKGLTLVVLLFTIPRCACGGGSCYSGPSCTFFPYNPNDNGPCEAVPGTHAISAARFAYSYCADQTECVLDCEPGFLDCDKSSSNGCEQQGSSCEDAGNPDAGPPVPRLLATLSGAPRGLAACSGVLFFFDDDALTAVDTQKLTSAPVLTSPAVPSGGLACDATNVYWATLSDSDGGPNGGIWEVPLHGTTPVALATALDPGVGIDVRSDRVYWIARTGVGDAGSTLAYTTDAGTTTGVMPAVETGAYKAFALGYDGDYSLADGTLWFNAMGADAGPPSPVLADASASALFAAAGGAYMILHGDLDGGPDAGDSLVAVDATSAKEISSGLGRVVATTGDGSAIVASDDAVYFVDLPVGAVTVLATPVLHVADVAMDSANAYWTTRGEGTTAAAVWSAPLP